MTVAVIISLLTLNLVESLVEPGNLSRQTARSAPSGTSLRKGKHECSHEQLWIVFQAKQDLAVYSNLAVYPCCPSRYICGQWWKVPAEPREKPGSFTLKT